MLKNLRTAIPPSLLSMIVFGVVVLGVVAELSVSLLGQDVATGQTRPRTSDTTILPNGITARYTEPAPAWTVLSPWSNNDPSDDTGFRVIQIGKVKCIESRVAVIGVSARISYSISCDWQGTITTSIGPRP